MSVFISRLHHAARGTKGATALRLGRLVPPEHGSFRIVRATAQEVCVVQRSAGTVHRARRKQFGESMGESGNSGDYTALTDAVSGRADAGLYRQHSVWS